MSSRWATRVLLAVVAVGSGPLLAGCDTDDGRALAEPPPGATAPPIAAETTTTVGPVLSNPPVGSNDTATMTLTSPAFDDGGVLPPEHTCIGENVSPALAWTGVPIEAAELAVTLEDVTDAESAPGDRFVHWVVAGLDPTVTGLATGADVVADEGAIVARNDSTEFGWFGPCPAGGEQRRYAFVLYALQAPSGVEAGVSGDDAIAAITAQSLASAVIEVTFTAP